MSKVITFSREFPPYHAKAGQPTHFVEKILNGLHENWDVWGESIPKFPSDFVVDAQIKEEKHHTIRGGDRWKVGDTFSPRVWSGQPYRSKQIVIAPDLTVTQVYELDFYYVDADEEERAMSKLFLNNKRISPDLLKEIAKNDGLSMEDLLGWFPNAIHGQLICWSDKISYEF